MVVGVKAGRRGCCKAGDGCWCKTGDAVNREMLCKPREGC